ncbi:Trans-zeatin O-beta-D-glucosyltransferase [Bertholletia excelsa]
MAAVGGEPTGACHIVAVPYPGRGHVNPMMNLCSTLALRNSRMLVTFVVTEEWLGLIGSEARPANFRFATLPNVLPSELDRAADVAGFVEAVHTKMEEPFELLLDRLEPPPRVIVADTFLCWAGDVGNRSNIPVASLWTMPAAVFSILYHFELLVENGDYPVEDLKREKRVDYIPGVSPIRLADLPSILLIKDRRLLRRALLINPAVAKSQSLLLNSISELEAPVITALRSILPVPIYSVGPLIPRSALQDHPSRPIARDGSDYLRWLDSQPHGSVLYVSLGSFLSVSRTQIDEISTDCGTAACHTSGRCVGKHRGLEKILGKGW